VLGFVVPAAFVSALTGLHSQEAFATPKAPPFKWQTY
jgi:hypothetical protein